MYQQSANPSFSRGFRGAPRGGRGGYGPQQNSYNPRFQNAPPPHYSGVGIDASVRFLRDKDLEGVYLCQDLEFVKQLRARLGFYSHGPLNSFPVSSPITLNKNNVKQLEWEPFVVTPVPLGIRFLLYVDHEGRTFMENSTQQIFKFSKSRLFQYFPTDTVLDGIVVRKMVRDGTAQNGNQDPEGKLTFVILDATRVKGVDVTQKSIQERISMVEAAILKPRLTGIKMNLISTKRDVFDLDIAKYESGAGMEVYLAPGFKDSYEYPLHSFLFKPVVGPYVCGKLGKPHYLWDLHIKMECVFRLMVSAQSQTKGDLLVMDPNKGEAKFANIAFTDELKKLVGSIVECNWMGKRWNFIRVRADRKHPDERRFVASKLEFSKKPVTGEMLMASLKKPHGN